MTELSDELLVAYVDGQLARKQTRAVERVLDQDDVIARRVDALKHAHSRLEAAFEAILAGEEIDVSAASAPPPGKGIWIEWRVAKAALGGIGILAAFVLVVAGYGWPLTIPGLRETKTLASKIEAAPDWREDVARAHALLSRASLEVGLDSQGNRDFAAFQLAHALGSNLKLPDLEPQGFRFVRAELLRLGDAPLAQILYLGSRGAPLALYAKKGGGSATLIPERYGAVNGVVWAEDGVAYLLAGEVEDTLLMRIATKIKLEPLPPPRSAPKPYTPLPHPLDPVR